MRSDECCRKNGQACLPPLCSGCIEHHALPRLRSITSNIRASSGYFEPKRIRSLQFRRFSILPAVELVTPRRFPPPGHSPSTRFRYSSRISSAMLVPESRLMRTGLAELLKYRSDFLALSRGWIDGVEL